MRKHGWPELLHEYVASCADREFAYGVWDCALFSADWIKLATDVDPAASLRGYSSMREAYEIIADNASMQALVTKLLDVEPMHPSGAGRGDIVLMHDHPALGESPEALGICLGVYSAFPNLRGLTHLRTLEAVSAWRVF